MPQDLSAPVLHGAPSNTTLVASCSAVPPAPTVTVSDNCDVAVPVTYGVTVSAGRCLAEYTLYRTWAAQDACSNLVAAGQTVIVQVSELGYFLNSQFSNN